ncbi:uncharacterized protein A4U43_C08F17570 [Asparagus officinalis]|nr:uncharacterized protein A4U43_C08F17570 [Asparagus officinalis]
MPIFAPTLPALLKRKRGEGVGTSRERASKRDRHEEVATDLVVRVSGTVTGLILSASKATIPTLAVDQQALAMHDQALVSGVKTFSYSSFDYGIEFDRPTFVSTYRRNNGCIYSHPVAWFRGYRRVEQLVGSCSYGSGEEELILEKAPTQGEELAQGEETPIQEEVPIPKENTPIHDETLTSEEEASTQEESLNQLPRL